MATPYENVFSNQDEEAKQKKAQQYQTTPLGGSPGITTTAKESGNTGTGGVVGNRGIGVSTGEPASSGSFVDVSKFKQRNADKAAALGQNIGDVLQGYGDTAQKNIDRVQGDFDNAIMKGQFRYGGKTLTSDTFQDFAGQGGDVLSQIFLESGLSEDDIKKYTSLVQANYGGPSGLSGQQAGNIQDSLSNVVDYGVRADQGGRGIVDEYYRPRIDNYSSQAGRADAILLGTDPAQAEVSEGQDYVKELALSDAYKDLIDSSEQKAREEAELQKSYRDTIAGYRDKTGVAYDEKLQESFDAYKGQVNSRRDYFKGQIQDYLNRINDEDDTNDALGLTAEELQYLGISKNELIGNLFNAGTGSAAADTVVNDLIEDSKFGEGWEKQALTDEEYKRYQDLNTLGEKETYNPESAQFGGDINEDDVGTWNEVAYVRDDDGNLKLDADGNPVTVLQQSLDENQEQLALDLDKEDSTSDTYNRRYFKNDVKRFFGSADYEHGEANAAFNALERLQASDIDLNNIGDIDEFYAKLESFIDEGDITINATGNEAGGRARAKVKATVAAKLKEYIESKGLRNVLKADDDTGKTFGTGANKTTYKDFYDAESGEPFSTDREGVTIDEDFWSDILG